MIHPPLGGARGPAADTQIHAQEILRIRLQLDEILAHHTGRDVADVEATTQREYFMSAKEALGYGMIDEIMERATSLAPLGGGTWGWVDRPPDCARVGETLS